MQYTNGMELSLDLDNSDELGASSYSQYFIVGNAGIKVLITETFDDRVAAINSELYAEAQEEFETLIKLKDSGHTPQPYELRIIEIQGRYHIAIAMEHIVGEFEPSGHEAELEIITDEIRRRYGIVLHDHYLGDRYNNNFIVDKDGHIFLIDFTPYYVTDYAREFEGTTR